MSKKYLITGAAGFIASQVCQEILDQGNQVIGLDNLNNYYDIRLKKWRLAQIEKHPNAQNFTFIELDIEDQEKLDHLFKKEEQFDAVLNLAARAGVRHSMENPHVYFYYQCSGHAKLA